MSSAQFIYSMHRVNRFYPPDREVLRDISISFYPGAKIGVLGHNGAGKSSLLHIMAGHDDAPDRPRMFNRTSVYILVAALFAGLGLLAAYQFLGRDHAPAADPRSPAQ